MILGIMDSLNKMSENLKDWFIENGNNPILWLGIFLGGILLFSIVYNYLKKGHN